MPVRFRRRRRFFRDLRLDQIDRDLCLAFKAHLLREAKELREAIAEKSARRARFRTSRPAPQTRSLAGQKSNGEGRNRTGDTTIFRIQAQHTAFGFNMPGKRLYRAKSQHPVSGHLPGVSDLESCGFREFRVDCGNETRVHCHFSGKRVAGAGGRYDSAMTAREELLERVTKLSESEADETLRLLDLQTDPVVVAFRDAPEDDEPWTETDEAAVVEANTDFATRRMVSQEEIKREFGIE
jgi:hypothetical protein